MAQHTREYLEALVEELSGMVPKAFLDEARQRAIPRAGGRSFPRRAPNLSNLSDDRLGKLDPDALRALRDRISSLLEAAEKVEKQDCGEEPEAFTYEWIGWKTCILIHEGFEQEQAFAIANDMAARQVKSLQEKEIQSIFWKADEERGLVYSVNLVPGIRDHQGDVVNSREIEDAAHNHMIRHRKSGLEHQEILRGALLVESYLAPQDMYLEGSGFTMPIRKGSWITVDKVLDKEVLEAIKRGVAENAREFTGT